MPRYWAIAPYHADDPDVYDSVWSFNLANGSISIGWSELGDISGLDESEIRERLCRQWPNYTSGSATNATRMLHKFYHTIAVDDVVVARRGLKQIAGIGKVIRTGYFDADLLRPAFEGFGPDYEEIVYSHHIDVEWQEDMRDVEYEDRIFGLATLHEIPEEKFHSLIEDDEEPSSAEMNGEALESPAEFILERYLEDFIVSNFTVVFQGDLKLFDDPEDGPIGQQFQTDVGVIDILAQEVGTGDFVVIELKKGRQADKVVGQVLRYMGWVADNLCQGSQRVSGLIICGEPDMKLTYALKMVSNVSIKYYRVDFRLED